MAASYGLTVRRRHTCVAMSSMEFDLATLVDGQGEMLASISQGQID